MNDLLYIIIGVMLVFNIIILCCRVAIVAKLERIHTDICFIYPAIAELRKEVSNNAIRRYENAKDEQRDEG